MHSRYDQLIGFVKGAVEHGAKRIRVHILTDGRDVPDGTGVKFAQQLQDDLAALPTDVDAKIASGGGRMGVTMDRYEVGCRFGDDRAHGMVAYAHCARGQPRG